MANTTTARIAAGTCMACGYVNATTNPDAGDRMVCNGCGQRVRLDYVVGSYSDRMPCDDRCQYATGPVCACACGGDNHRAGYIHVDMVPVFIRDRDARRHADRQARAVAKATAEEARAAEVRAGLLADYPLLAELLGDRYADTDSDFVRDMRDRINAGQDLSPRQLDTALRVVTRDQERDARAAERATREAAARAAGVTVPTGRITFTGEIVSAKVDTDYRHSYTGRTDVKITVRAADGWAAYGTAPKSMYPAEYSAVTFAAWVASLPGQTVTLTAEVQPSNKDALFGFFKRPRVTEPDATPAPARTRKPRPARCHRDADPAVCQHTPPCHPTTPAPEPFVSAWAAVTG